MSCLRYAGVGARRVEALASKLVNKYFTVNLFLTLLCCVDVGHPSPFTTTVTDHVTINGTESGNGSTTWNPEAEGLPPDFPAQWREGIIPFAFNFYTLNSKRLMNLVRLGHSYIEQQSCLVFQEHDPVQLASMTNYTYLYYTHSDILESCCLPFYTKPIGRRMVLITPICSLTVGVAHAVLHGLGLVHYKNGGINREKAINVLFVFSCQDQKAKFKEFEDRFIGLDQHNTDNLYE